MSRILVVAESGFGKTTSLIKNDEYGIKGLSPKSTYIISVTSKPLPGRGTRTLFPLFPNFGLHVKDTALFSNYRRIIVNNPQTNAVIIAHAIKMLGTTGVKNIVLDDANYVMQDYYMEKALSTGWDSPKRIGFDMGQIFSAVEKLPEAKNFIMLAHGEEYDKADGRKGYRMKTTGKMVQEYSTPEGKFDIVLIGKSSYDEINKKVKKEFVTNDDGVFSTAKSHQIFPSLYIPNDMGYVIEMAERYYNEVEAPAETPNVEIPSTDEQAG